MRNRNSGENSFLTEEYRTPEAPGHQKELTVRWDDRFSALLVEEISLPVRGSGRGELEAEADLFERGTKVKKSTHGFAEYAASAFADTMTLYLHGLCCDIDVEPGPRQLPTRPLRKRLEVLEELYPPPAGYAVFPDDRPVGK